MNQEAIEKSIKVGLLLNCNIAEICKWDRKNYFYPDMPKNYQISQFDQPICEGGEVEIEMPEISSRLSTACETYSNTLGGGCRKIDSL